jgi:hypothetical protein
LLILQSFGVEFDEFVLQLVEHSVDVLLLLLNLQPLCLDSVQLNVESLLLRLNECALLVQFTQSVEIWVVLDALLVVDACIRSSNSI